MTIEQANQALQVLVNAINIAQKRGAYTLQESSAIYAAIQSFSEPGQENVEVDVEADNTQLEET